MKTNFSLLGVPLLNIAEADLDDKIAHWLHGETFRHICTVNPEILVRSERTIKYKKCIQKTINIVDGFGIQLISKVFYRTHISRTSGVHLAEKLAKICAQESIPLYLLGGRNVVAKAKKYLEQKYPQLTICGTHEGSPDALPPDLQTAKPAAILVAYGAPGQEFWLEKFGPQILSLRIGIGVGGTFDFWAGTIQRAPIWIQKIGLEWLFRLIQEPRRINRILTAVVVFPWLCLREKLQLWRRRP